MILPDVYPPERLMQWVRDWQNQAKVIVPGLVDEIPLYLVLREDQELDWDFVRPVLPLKEFLFPPTERLFLIQKDGKGVQLRETLPEGKQIILGARPCEARGLRILDKLFIDTQPEDPYYRRRREDTYLVGIACKSLGETCFCTSTGGGPDDWRYMDIFLREVDGGFRVQIVSERGKQLLEWIDPIERARLLNGLQPAEELWLPSEGPDFYLPVKEDWINLFNIPLWMQHADRCLSCRVCAYVCPTCRCFDLRDEPLGEGVFERIRCWDSCMSPAYRKIAGGHNPRASKDKRLRNRIYCKFYYYPHQYHWDTSACTGCGRCIEYCPVNIDIVEVLKEISGYREKNEIDLQEIGDLLG